MACRLTVAPLTSQAEERPFDTDIIPQARYAVRVKADFVHEIAMEETIPSTKSGGERESPTSRLARLLKPSQDGRKSPESDGNAVHMLLGDLSKSSIASTSAPFKLADIVLKIPHGTSDATDQHGQAD